MGSYGGDVDLPNKSLYGDIGIRWTGHVAIEIDFLDGPLWVSGSEES